MYEISTARVVKHRDASQHHGDEHRDIDPENCLRHLHGTGLLPRPWRRFDALEWSIFAALRGFMLLAPLADLPAESEPRKLPSALNAIRHAKMKPADSDITESCGPSPADYHGIAQSMVESPAATKIHASHIKWKEYEPCESLNR